MSYDRYIEIKFKGNILFCMKIFYVKLYKFITYKSKKNKQIILSNITLNLILRNSNFD